MAQTTAFNPGQVLAYTVATVKRAGIVLESLGSENYLVARLNTAGDRTPDIIGDLSHVELQFTETINSITNSASVVSEA